MKWLLLSVAMIWSPAHAETDIPLTIDMTVNLLDQDGKVIPDQFDQQSDDPKCTKCRALTLGNAVMHALSTVNSQTEQDVTFEKKWAWAEFGTSLRNNKEAKLNHAQGELIVNRLGKLYPGVILMRAIPLIDPNRIIPEIK